MKMKWVKFIGIFASFLCILWVIGLVMTFTHYFYKGDTAVKQPEVIGELEEIEVVETTIEPISELTKTGFHVVALGDSLTVGAGDHEEQGYVGYIVEQLSEQTSEEILVNNFAINGLTSDRLLAVLEQQEVQTEIEKADLILLTIGGNDLFRGGQTLIELNLEEIALIEKQFLQNLTQIMNRIRELTPNATVYFSGLYHPFSYLPNADITTKVIMDWNHHTALEISNYPNSIFVPMFDLFQLNLNTYLSDDRFHPSAEGYQQMAKRISALISWDGESSE